MTETLQQAVVQGIGVSSGQQTQVTINRLPNPGQVLFTINGVDIPAHPDYVVDKTRGVTLGKDGQFLSIVEHFLAACAMLNVSGFHLTIEGAPELPILDGGAKDWIDCLQTHFNISNDPVTPTLQLTQPVFWYDEEDPDHYIVAFPSKELQLTYLVDFPHPDLTRRWLTWTASTGNLVEDVAPARTFGMMSDLPILQAKGMAQGVTIDNSLGLMDDGGFTAPLRIPNEPICHKFLDLIGDLMLCGVPIRQLQAHIIASKAGHASHIPFGIQLRKSLKTDPQWV